MSNRSARPRPPGWHRDGGIRPTDLARILRGYGVESRNVRMPGGEQRKGYLYDDLVDVFERYLPSTPGTAVPPSHVPESADDTPSDQGWDGGTGGTPPGTREGMGRLPGTSHDLEGDW